MHGRVQLAVADTGPALACAAMPLALLARGLPRLRCCHTAFCEPQVPPVPRTQARPHAPLRSGGHPVAFHEYPLLPPRPLGDRQRRLLSPTSRPAPACVGRAWRAAAPLAPLASALVFSRRLLVRPCRLFESKKTVYTKKKHARSLAYHRTCTALCHRASAIGRCMRSPRGSLHDDIVVAPTTGAGAQEFIGETTPMLGTML